MEVWWKEGMQCTELLQSQQLVISLSGKSYFHSYYMCIQQLQHVCRSHHRQTLIMHIQHPPFQWSLQPLPLQMSQNHQRGTRKGSTNLMFIKHRSDQIYLTNFWWVQKKWCMWGGEIWKIKGINTEWQADRQRLPRAAGCHDSESGEICIMSKKSVTLCLWYTEHRLLVCVFVPFLMVTFLSYSCTEQENVECYLYSSQHGKNFQLQKRNHIQYIIICTCFKC